MPAYDENTLSDEQIRNVVAYLLDAAGVVLDTDPLPDQIAENAAIDAYTGITAAAKKSTLYTLVDDAGSRFSIAESGDSSGRITVAKSELINYEKSTQHVVIAQSSNAAINTTTAFTIRVINVFETTLVDTMPDVDNTVDAIAGAEVRGLLLQATHADGEPITGWTITAGEETFVFTESQNSSTQRLRIKEGVSPIAGSIDVGVEARTEYDPATQSFSIQIRKVEATVTASLQDGVSTIAEGERTTLVLSMSRTLPAEASMAVHVNNDGTNGLIMLSTDTINFVSGPITVSIPADELSAMLTIRVDDDEPAAAERTAALRVTSDDPRLIDLPPDVMLTIAADAKAEISVDPTMFMLDEEDQPQTIRLTLSPSTAEPVTVTAIVAEDDRDQIALTEDGSQVTQSIVSFDSDAAFTVQAVNDGAAETEQTYTITLEVTAGHAGLAQGQNTITVTIPANDTPTLQVVVEPPPVVEEPADPAVTASTYTWVLGLNTAPAKNVTVELDLQRQAMGIGPPIELIPSAFTFMANRSTQTMIKLVIQNDDHAELAQSATITMSAVGDNRDFIIVPDKLSDPGLVFTIPANDTPTLQVIMSPPLVVEEPADPAVASTYTWVLGLNTAPAKNVTVELDLQRQAMGIGPLIELIPPTFTFMANGSTQTMIKLVIQNDDHAELAQSATITISAVGDNRDFIIVPDELSDPGLVFTIPANDTPTLNASLSKDVIAEDDRAKITFRANRPPAAPVVITASLSPGDDRRVGFRPNDSVVLETNQTEASMELVVARDDDPQRTRFFMLSFEVEGPVMELVDDTFSFTVPASDTPTISFGKPDYRVSEEAGTIDVTIFVRPPLLENLELQISTKTSSESPLTEGSDYATLPERIVLEQGQSSAVIKVQIINDGEEEEEESLLVEISFADSAFARLGEPAAARLTVLRNDQPNNLTFELESADLPEGTTQRFSIISKVEETTRVNVTVDEDHRDQIGIAEDEHSALQNKLTLEIRAESSVTFYVTAKEDTEPEPTADYKIYLEKPDPAYTYSLSISTLTITVERNDGPAVSADSDRVTIAEGLSRVFMLTMASSPVDNDPVTIHIRENDKRLEITEPTPQPEAGGGNAAEVTFSMQENLLTKTFEVRVIGDELPQRSSEAVITLSCTVGESPEPCSGSGAAELKTRLITITIPADDTPTISLTNLSTRSGVITQAMGPITVSEDPGALYVTLDIDPLPIDEVEAEIVLRTNNGGTGDLSNGDLKLPDIIFQPGERQKEFQIRIVSTDGAELEESGILELRYKSGFAQIKPSASTFRLTVPENVPILSLSPNAVSVKEGRSTNVTVIADRPVSGDVVVRLVLQTDDGGLSAGDIDGTLPVKATITDGNTTAVFSIRANNDNETEPKERGTFVLERVSGLAMVDAEDRTFILTIPESNLPTISLSHDAISLEEGRSTNVTVIADRPVSGDVVVQLVLQTDDGGLIAGDIDGTLPVKATITNGNTTAVFSIRANNDNETEPEERGTFVLERVSGLAMVDAEDRTFMLTIPESNLPTISLSPDDASVEEGRSTNVTVIADRPVSGDVVVRLVLQTDTGGLIAGDIDGTLPVKATITNGNTTAVFSIRANDDNETEPEEQGTFVLERVSGLAMVDAEDRTFMLTIPENDPPVANLRDSDENDNTVAENASDGVAVGITVVADNAVGYELLDDADGRFDLERLDASARVVVKDGNLLDYETATTHQITVQAFNAGSRQSRAFIIMVADVNEFPLSKPEDVDEAANTVAEDAMAGSTVGITVQAVDLDGSAVVTYSLTGNPDDLFAVDTNTGVVTLKGSLDYEASAERQIIVQADSSDGSAATTQAFTIVVTDVNEFPVGEVMDTNDDANEIAQGARPGDEVGITAQAADRDGTALVSYFLSDNAGGLFAVDARTGVVTLASPDYTPGGTYTIEITARSDDGSSNAASFTITAQETTSALVGDPAAGKEDVYDQRCALCHADGSALGSSLGAPVLGTGNWQERFNRDGYSGLYGSVRMGLNRMPPFSSDVLTDTDLRNVIAYFLQEANVDTAPPSVAIDPPGDVLDTDSAPDQIVENAANGDYTGITAAAEGAMGYALLDNAEGRFDIVASGDSSGRVTVANNGLINYEAQVQHIVVVQAFNRGGISTMAFTIMLTDVNEFPLGKPEDVDEADNTVAEDAEVSSTVGITVRAADPDGSAVVTYSLIDNPDDLFAVDTNTGVVTLKGSLDYEASAEHQITVQANSDDGSAATTQAFTIMVTDVNEFPLGKPEDVDETDNTVAEDAMAGSTVGITVQAADPDGSAVVTYSLAGNPDDLFAVDTNTGVVTLKGSLDYEAGAERQIIVQADSSDGSAATTEAFTINLTNVDELSLKDTDGRNNVVLAEANAPVQGLVLEASHKDNAAIAGWELRQAADLFELVRPQNHSTQTLRIQASADAMAYSDQTTDVTIIARTMHDAATQVFSVWISSTEIVLVGVIEDTDAAPDEVAENAPNGTMVGVTIDADNAVSYGFGANADGRRLNAEGRFALQQANSSARVIVADGGLLNYEASTRHYVTVEAYNQNRTDTQRKTFTIIVSNVNETILRPSTDATEFTVTPPSTEVGIAYTAEHPDGTPELSLTQGAEFFGLVRANGSYKLFAKEEALMRGRHRGKPQAVTVRAAYQEDAREHSITVTISREAFIRLKIKVYLEGAL